MTMHQDKAKRVLNKLVNKMIDGDTYEWPPVCAYLIYQPVRPSKNKEEKTIKEHSAAE